jgi:hypothetical protein
VGNTTPCTCCGEPLQEAEERNPEVKLSGLCFDCLKAEGYSPVRVLGFANDETDFQGSLDWLSTVCLIAVSLNVVLAIMFLLGVLILTDNPC